MRAVAALVAALVIALSAAAPAHAAKLALLIGVTEYPALAPDLQLKAPANDVRLMRRVLLQRGFEAADIEMLADGVDGARLPTREAILASLRSLAERARRNDFVYLHFSGHGAQQLADTGAAAGGGTPGDTWQPIFLPRDVRGWDGQSKHPVPNALTDTVLREAIDRINATGAFVFAVFDACHSARLVRGVLPAVDGSQLRLRRVPATALGYAANPPGEVRAPWGAAAPASAPARIGHAVYFYAAQSYELAAAVPTSAGDRAAWHGVLSWHVAQALALGQPMSHRQLAQHLLSRYDRLPMASVTPLFGGDGLDEAVFGQQAPLVRQWPIERRQDKPMLPAGALAGLAEGALLALLSDPLAPGGSVPGTAPAGTLGFLRLAALEPDRAALEPIAWQGRAAPVLDPQTKGSWARLMTNPPAFALRLAVERDSCETGCTAGRALAQLRREGIAGVDARWVGSDELADVRLRASTAGVELLLPGAPDTANRALWGHAAPAADDVVGLEVLVQQVSASLHRVARARNLLQLASRLALRQPESGLQVGLKLQRGGRGAELPATVDRLAELGVGDVLLLDGRNAGVDPVDLVVFWIGADQSIRRIYPADRRDTPRLAAGEKLKRSGWRIDADSEGTERLLVLAAPMRAGHEAADFAFLEQPPLSRLRGAVDPDLQALFDACFADYRQRGSAPALPSDRIDLQVFTFRIERP